MRVVLLIAFMLILASCVDTIPSDGDPSGDQPGDIDTDPPEQEQPSEPSEPGIGLRGAYFDPNGELLVSRIDPTVDFDWHLGSPAPPIPEDYFSAVWEGELLAPAEGSYVLSVRVDDGFRLFVDGALVAESWKNQGGPRGDEPLYHSAPIELSASLVPIRLEYYEAYATSVVRLYWRSADEDASLMRIIGSDALYPADEPGSAPSDVALPPTDGEHDSADDSDPDDSGSGDDGSDGGSDDVVMSDGTYGARPVARSTTPSTGDTFVSPSGQDEAACTQTDPCSLGTGVDRGGRIWLNPGTYAYTGQLSIGDGKTLESIDPNDKAIIDFAKSAESRITLGHDNVLRNIVVRNADMDGIKIFGNRNRIEGVVSEYHRYSGIAFYPSSGYSNTKNPVGASDNTIIDTVSRYNQDNTGDTQSDADGVSISAGRGNELIHVTTYGNADDGIDVWASYETLVMNCDSYDNGFDAQGEQVGNGMQYKMGASYALSGYAPVPNNHRFIDNWAHGRHIGYFSENGGEGFAQISGNVCGPTAEPCNP